MKKEALWGEIKDEKAKWQRLDLHIVSMPGLSIYWFIYLDWASSIKGFLFEARVSLNGIKGKVVPPLFPLSIGGWKLVAYEMTWQQLFPRILIWTCGLKSWGDVFEVQGYWPGLLSTMEESTVCSVVFTKTQAVLRVRWPVTCCFTALSKITWSWTLLVFFPVRCFSGRQIPLFCDVQQFLCKHCSKVAR